jgi:aarF domain-containing kinase
VLFTFICLISHAEANGKRSNLRLENSKKISKFGVKYDAKQNVFLDLTSHLQPILLASLHIIRQSISNFNSLSYQYASSIPTFGVYCASIYVAQKCLFTIPIITRTALSASSSNLKHPSLSANYHKEHMSKSERVSRAFRFWRKAGPIIFHYKFTKAWVNQVRRYDKDQRDVIYDKLHDRYAPLVLEIILDLKGLYVKLGQIISSRPDFVPKQYIDTLSCVQDSITPWPIDEIKDIVSHSLQIHHNLSFDDVFLDFDEQPLGCASIGQVHAATIHNSLLKKIQTDLSDSAQVNRQLYSGGSKVAVKVMHTDAKDRFQNDFRVFKWVCKIALPGWKTFLIELERQMMTEFNYITEANHLRTVRHNMATSPYSRQVKIPDPLEYLCTRNVLVMELLEGKKLSDSVEDKLTKVLKGNRIVAQKIINDKREALFRGVGHNDGQSLFEQVQSLISKLDQKSLLDQINIPLKLGLLIRQQKKLLDLLLDIHGHQIFINGCFNGDPHPGNILELENGKIGLIDYGQCKILSEAERLKLSKIVYELSSQNINDGTVTAAMHDFGFRFKNNLDHVIRKTAALFFDSDLDRIKLGLPSPQDYLLYLQSLDPMLEVPDAAVFVARASFLFRGMATMIGENHIHTCRRWASHAKFALETIQ